MSKNKIDKNIMNIMCRKKMKSKESKKKTSRNVMCIKNKKKRKEKCHVVVCVLLL